MEKFGWQFRPRDKVIQTENDYDKGVFIGDIGQIVRIDPVEREVTIRVDQREVVYDFGELDEVSRPNANRRGSYTSSSRAGGVTIHDHPSNSGPFM